VVGKSNAVELWHTRLGVANKTATPDENNAKDRTARAIYTPDLNPQAVAQGASWLDHQSNDPRVALDGRDRQELVYLTSYFGTAAKPQAPLPVQLDQLMLTPLGGYLKSLGTWNPPMLDTSHVLTVEQWKHIATLGRDQYVRVVYKGYLAPFCHRASLIKVTERRIVPLNSGYYAMLHQRMYIVVQNPRRDFPVFGQQNGGRNFPFRRVDALTLVTPDLDNPGQRVPDNTNIMVGQSLFWPVVNNAPFLFGFRFWDMENNISEASLPVVFGDAETSQTAANCQNMVDLYNQGAGSGSDDDTWTCTPFNAQSVAFAPTTKPGDTRYDASEMCWRICLQPIGPTTVQQVYELNLPLFYPKLFQAQVASASIKRITGDATPAKVRFYPGYVTSGFDPTANAGEVILQVNDTILPALRFGAAGKTDQAGGLSSPDTLVVGFSRKSGPVGGTAAASPATNGTPLAPHPSLQTWSSGTFNPADFFGGFASAKLLGAVKLSDIIGPLLGGLDSNLGDAPRMVQQELFQIVDAVTTAENNASRARCRDSRRRIAPSARPRQPDPGDCRLWRGAQLAAAGSHVAFRRGRRYGASGVADRSEVHGASRQRSALTASGDATHHQGVDGRTGRRERVPSGAYETPDGPGYRSIADHNRDRRRQPCEGSVAKAGAGDICAAAARIFGTGSDLEHQPDSVRDHAAQRAGPCEESQCDRQ
jgi:hypothetical protein